MSFCQSFTEGFDTGPSGWVDGTGLAFGNTVDGDVMAFASGNWVARNLSNPPGSTGWFCNVTQLAPLSGAGLANANYNSTTGTNTIDNWLMSPVETFHNGDTISFWTRTVTGSSFPDRLYLALSQNGASVNEADFSVLLGINPTLALSGYPETWTQYSATLSGLSAGGANGRFGLNYNVTNGGPSGANSNFIGIDDVSYTAVPEPATVAALAWGALAFLRRRRNV